MRLLEHVETRTIAREHEGRELGALEVQVAPLLVFARDVVVRQRSLGEQGCAGHDQCQETEPVSIEELHEDDPGEGASTETCPGKVILPSPSRQGAQAVE